MPSCICHDSACSIYQQHALRKKINNDVRLADPPSRVPGDCDSTKRHFLDMACCGEGGGSAVCAAPNIVDTTCQLLGGTCMPRAQKDTSECRTPDIIAAFTFVRNHPYNGIDLCCFHHMCCIENPCEVIRAELVKSRRYRSQTALNIGQAFVQVQPKVEPVRS